MIAADKIPIALDLLAEGLTYREVADAAGITIGQARRLDENGPPKERYPREVKFAEVPAYFCPGCRRTVTLSPCVACLAKQTQAEPCPPCELCSSDGDAGGDAGNEADANVGRLLVAEALADCRPPAPAVPPKRPTAPRSLRPLQPWELFPWLRKSRWKRYGHAPTVSYKRKSSTPSQERNPCSDST